MIHFFSTSACFFSFFFCGERRKKLPIICIFCITVIFECFFPFVYSYYFVAYRFFLDCFFHSTSTGSKFFVNLFFTVIFYTIKYKNLIVWSEIEFSYLKHTSKACPNESRFTADSIEHKHKDLRKMTVDR